MVKLTNTSAACERRFIVYALHRAATDELIYIGKGVNGRPYAHERAAKGGYHRNKYLMRIINKDLKSGLGGPRIDIIMERLTEEAAHRIEMDLISKIGRLSTGDGPLVNLTIGGEGTSGYKCSPESIDRRRQKQIGKPLSAEHKEKLREVWKSEEYRAWQHRLRTGKKRPNAGKAISAAKKGKPLSEAGKEGIRKAAQSLARREKLSRAFKGRKFSDETKLKMSIAAKARTDRIRGQDGKFNKHG
jgi:hypothetical protein